MINNRVNIQINKFQTCTPTIPIEYFFADRLLADNFEDYREAIECFMDSNCKTGKLDTQNIQEKMHMYIPNYAAKPILIGTRRIFRKTNQKRYDYVS